MGIFRPRYHRMKPPPTSNLERSAIVFERLLNEYPENQRYIGWAFGLCRRCRDQLYSVRCAKTDALLLLFCRTCYWFNCNSDTRVFSRANRAKPPPGVPLRYSPEYPMERELRKYLRTIPEEE